MPTLTHPPEPSTGPAPARTGLSPRGWILLAFFGALAVYASGTAPSVLDRDSAELQTVAITGGIAHTTGYPLFSMVGWLFAHVLPGEPAFRVNLMSSIFGAACLAQLVVVGLELGIAPAVAFAGAIIYGAGFAFWAASLRAEVYTLSTFVFLLAWHRTLVALRTGALGARAWAAFLLGLSLAGQLSCAPAVAVLGLALAWDAWRRGPRIVDFAALTVPLLLGGTPYLYTAWADAHAIGLDYLRHVDWVFFPSSGIPDSHFDTVAKRLRWLVFDRNIMPGMKDTSTFSTFAHYAYHGGALLTLFELGPVATLLLVPGLRRLWTERRDEFWRSGALVLGSAIFAARVVGGPAIGIFMLYALGPLALVAARGLDAVTRRWSGPGARRALLVPALAVLVMVPPHALRVWAYEHPIPPGHWKAMDEDGSRPLYLLWRLHDPYQYRDFGRAAMATLPESCLVVGAWRDLPLMYYMRYVEHRRPDLALQPYSYPQHLVRVRVWQEQHDLARTPIVFLQLLGEMRPHITSVDSVEVSRRHWLYYCRTPLRDLPVGKGDLLVP